ncbi:hypothetical protein IFM89_031434 [Coptis chinensis]|uniref:Uncharacterized protein n=1 Tax=Coptis chinensis TaxID=261450 RepID=A0A835LTC4_9MAGN|nr:hypothetical protein IFM89_031434 [Coptis chinensis]
MFPKLSIFKVGENGNWVSNFVNYLPQDEAIATGLGAEDGALDPVESQRVVDLLNRDLSRKRWYDYPHHGTKGLVAEVIVGELELCRRVFMALYRMDPGVRASHSLSATEHGVTNAMRAQPMLHENMSVVVSHFLSVVQTMHQCCDSLVETSYSYGGRDDPEDGQIHEDLLEVMNFINDAIA